MPFRSRDTLAEWLAEFERLGHAAGPEVRVVEQDGSQGANTGLVAATLTSGFRLYIQPVSLDSDRWVVTIEPSEDAVELRADELSRLATEIATIEALCVFLETRARAAA